MNLSQEPFCEDCGAPGYAMTPTEDIGLHEYDQRTRYICPQCGTVLHEEEAPGDPNLPPQRS